MNSKPNIILIIVGALIVAAIAYWYFFARADNEPSLTVTDAQSASVARFQSLLAELDPINLDTTILSDPRFMERIDLTTAISVEPMNRTDPFAP